MTLELNQLFTPIEVGELRISDPSEVDEAELAKAGLSKNPDLMYLDFILCHANTNKNKDNFQIEELKVKHDTIRLKPVNWEHSNLIIGTHYHSELIETIDQVPKGYTIPKENFVPFVFVKSVIYAKKFPAYASIMRKRYAEKTLKHSMETWFSSAKCSECGQSFSKAAEYCSCLNDRFSEGSSTARVLEGITFGGSAIVKSPADEDAVTLAIANKITDFLVKSGELQDQIHNENLSKMLGRVFDTTMWLISTILFDPLVPEEEKVGRLDGIFLDLKKLIETPKSFVKDTLLAKDSNGDSQSKNDNSGGSLKMAFKQFETEAEYNQFVENLKTQLTEDKTRDAEIAGLKTSLVEKEKSITELEKQLTDSKTALDKVQAQIDEQKKIALADSRLAKLAEAGIVVSDEDKVALLDDLKAWSDEKFAAFFKLQQNVLASASKKTEKVTRAEDGLPDKKNQDGSADASSDKPKLRDVLKQIRQR